MNEIERFLRLRQLRDEPRPTYLLRVARAAIAARQQGADRLTPKAYAWVVDAAARIADGGYPIEFDDERIRPSVGEQLFDLLEAEDQLDAAKKPRKRTGTAPKEERRGDYQRVAQYILTWPGASDMAVASDLSAAGWSVSKRRVSEVRAELRRAVEALKISAITLRRPDGTRIISL